MGSAMFEALQLRKDDVDRHKEELRQRIGELTPEARKAFYVRLARETRDPDTYAVLNYFFLAGLHHLYLGKILRGMINLFVLLLGVGLVIGAYPGIGGLLIVSILLLEMPALFRAEVIVYHHNNQLSEKFLAENSVPDAKTYS